MRPDSLPFFLIASAAFWTVTMTTNAHARDVEGARQLSGADFAMVQTNGRRSGRAGQSFDLPNRVDNREDARQERRQDNRQDARQDRRQDARQDRRQDRRWDTAWRNNDRYDWNRHRVNNRRLYRAVRYVSPIRNHRYRRYVVGLRMASALRASTYWIANPGTYRLPPTGDGYRWVRYYNDVVLVDVYTGEVEDVIYNFFW